MYSATGASSPLLAGNGHQLQDELLSAGQIRHGRALEAAWTEVLQAVCGCVIGACGTLGEDGLVGCMIQECGICSTRRRGNRLKTWLAERGQPAFRAAQIRKWVFEGRAESFEAMSDLPKGLRAELAADFQLWTSKVARHPQSADGTEKLLLELADGGKIECVLLRDDDRRTHLHQHAGRLRDGLRVLRQRPGRRRSQSDQRRDRRADAAACSGCCRPTSG